MTDSKQLLKDLQNLTKEGVEILLKEEKKEKGISKDSGESPNEISLQQAYQRWYSKSLKVIEQIMPDRYKEFVQYYEIEKRKEIDFLSYTIKDYLLGLRTTRFNGINREDTVNYFAAFVSKFQLQILMIEACADRLNFTLSNLQGVVQADLFDSELEAAIELMKKGHLRAAGALAGVTLERHLGTVIKTKQIKITKKDPTIAELNDVLKKEEAIDVPNWRYIQRLGDLRNLSVHSKEREPTKDEIGELIKGTQKVVKTVF